jgi:hypothetical protein
MSDHGAIREMSVALETMLTAAMAPLTVPPNPAPVAQIHDLRPPPGGTPPVLTLFLYEISEDSTLRNRPSSTTLVASRYESTKPRLPLILRYLVTPWAGDRATEQLMMGRVLQVLYDSPNRPGATLPLGLADLEVVSITLAPLTLEERTRVWWSIQQPYRLSLNYEVRVIEIDPERVDVADPVRRRVFDTFVPDTPSESS